MANDPSYHLIDYSLRSAKFAERKMLCEMFGRLTVFAPLEKYCYIGFGSIWFADCVLFHRTLGIKQLISIEEKGHHKKRFEFNIPYQGIELRMAHSSNVLQNLDWNQRTIIWLDYDDQLSPSILDDVDMVTEKAQSGTALVVSVQTQGIQDKQLNLDKPTPIKNRDQFLNLFGAERTPRGLRSDDFEGWNLSTMSRKVILESIESTLKTVNMTRQPKKQIHFQQTVAFEYSDGAKMTTIGGIFVNQAEQNQFKEAGFEKLSFYQNAEEAIRIEVPKLTPREMRHLDRQLPCPNGETIEADFVPEKDAKNYAKFYRYLPNFASFEP